MRKLTNLVKYLTIAGLILIPISNQIPKKKNFLDEFYHAELNELKNYDNPFTNIKGTSTKIKEFSKKTDKLGYQIVSNHYQEKINQNTVGLINNTMDLALQEYQHERNVRAEHSELCSLVLEWILRKDKKWAKEKDSLIKLRGDKKGTSYFVPGKEKYYPGNPTYKEESIEFQKKLKWFGSYLATPKKKRYYNRKRSRELRKLGLEPTDCITYLLKSLSEASGENYMLRSCSDAKGLSKKLKDFEGIYVAQNTTKRDSRFVYSNGSREKNFTLDYLRAIKRNNYPFKINYLVMDEKIKSPQFSKFIKSLNGFVFFHEGNHVAFLNKGKILGAHMISDPLENVVFYQKDLISSMDNDNSGFNYQSAVLYVPKGSVKAFLAKNYEEIYQIKHGKGPLTYEEFKILSKRNGKMPFDYR